MSRANFVLDDASIRKIVALSAYGELQQLTEPLRSIHVKNFVCHVHYLDGRFYALNNSPNYLQQYHQQHLINGAFGSQYIVPDGIFLEKMFYVGCSFYRDIAHQEHRVKMNGLLKQYDMSTGIIIQKNYLDRYEYYLFRFSLEEEEHLFDLLFQYQELFYHFIHFFQDRGAKLLTRAENHCIQLPWKPIPWSPSRGLTSASFTSKDKSQFLAKTSFRKCYLSISRNNYLTAQELNIVRLLKQGKNLIQISEQLKIAGTTTDFHMKNIKKKMSSKTLFDMGFKLGSLGDAELNLNDSR